MVVQGRFALQLIDAETQQPLDEYRGPSGTVHYAVAKENGEYFLRFQVLENADNNTNEDSTTPEQQAQTNLKSAKANNTGEMMYFRPSVDGKDLGFYTNLTAEQGARDVGLWTYVNGIGTNQALKFETTSTTAASGSSVNGASSGVNSTGDLEDAAGKDTTTDASAPPKLYMGNVQVQISKAVFTGQQKRVYTSLPPLTNNETVVVDPAAVSISASSSMQEDDDIVPNESSKEDAAHRLNPASASASSSSSKAEGDTKSTDQQEQQQQQTVPVLRSREGSQRFQEKVTDECPTYKPGELVETITIHYGSTAALIQAGILVPVGGLIPQFVGVSASDTSTANTTAADKDAATEAPPATFVPTNTAPSLALSLLPATNSTLESVTAPVSLTTGLVPNQLVAAEMMTRATPAAVVDPSSPSKGDSVTTATVKRGLSSTMAGKDTSPPAKKACRESTNTRESTATTGRVTRASAAVSSS